jgi:hypothetical protein
MAGEFSILANIDAFLVGMDSASKKTKAGDVSIRDVTEQINNTIATMDKDFRSVYDRLMPNIHILDGAITANLLLDAMYNTPEKFLNFMEVNTDPSAGPITGLPEELKLEVQNKLTPAVRANISKKVIAAIAALHSKVHKPAEPDPIYALNTKSKVIFDNLQDIIISDSIIESAKIAAVLKAGRDFKNTINSIFGNRAIIGAINKDLGSSDTVFVFYASSFAGSKTRINSVISKAFTKALNESSNISKSYNVSQDIQAGSFINFAHSTVKIGTESFLNSPSYAKLMYNVAQNPAGNKRSPFSEALRASNYFKIKTGQIKVGVKVEKNFTENTDVLAQFGLTITISDNEIANKAMGILESKYGSGIYKSTQKATQAFRTSILTRQLEKIAINILGGDNVVKGRSSPSILEFIENTLIGNITGKKTSGKKYSTIKEKNISVDYTSAKGKKSTLSTSNATKNNVSYPKGKFDSPASLAETYNLANLQILLDSNLQDIISANMGKGNERGILNYQTGRFAASVKVERLSESRQGMITAFYTYMKNPYQTFEPGYRQGSPRSRDPKLLIAKSIRELAATVVKNRLRAVQV